MCYIYIYMKFNPKYTLSPTLVQQLLEIEKHKEAINILPITAPLIASLRETARLMSTHYSTQIEGNMLSPKEVAQIAKGKQGGFPGRERDEREVRNYFRALEYVEFQLKKNADITEELIQCINGLVLVGSEKPRAYREGQNVIKDSSTGAFVYMPPEAKDVSILMQSLVTWADEQIKIKELPAPVIAGLVHYQFATIHPYYDGNGRTARLLTTFILHKMGYGMKGIYSLEEYYAKNLNGYYQSLNIGEGHNYYMGRAEADITPFLDYFLSAMANSFRSVREKAEQMKKLTKEKTSAYETQKVRELRPQQRQVLSLFQKSKEITAIELAKHLGIKHQNTRILIKKWLEQDFIQIENASKKTRTYALTKEWEEMLMDKQEQRLKELNRDFDTEQFNHLDLEP